LVVLGWLAGWFIASRNDVSRSGDPSIGKKLLAISG